MKIVEVDKKTNIIKKIYRNAYMPGLPGELISSDDGSVKMSEYISEYDYVKIGDETPAVIGSNISSISIADQLDAPVGLKGISKNVRDALVRICDAIGIPYTLDK